MRGRGRGRGRVRGRGRGRGRVRGRGSRLVCENTRVVAAVDAVVQQQGRRPLAQQHSRTEARGKLVVIVSSQ